MLPLSVLHGIVCIYINKENDRGNIRIDIYNTAYHHHVCGVELGRYVDT